VYFNIHTTVTNYRKFAPSWKLPPPWKPPPPPPPPPTWEVHKLKRVNKKGGGVGIYVTKETNDIQFAKFFIEDAIIESIFIEINMLGSKNIIIGTIIQTAKQQI
jgi:hypothetical protein